MPVAAVARLDEIQEGSSKAVVVNGREIALFKVGGKVYAIENLCPHRGGPLAEGYLEGAVVTCPWHAWQFDVTNGNCKTVPESRQRTYPVEVRDGDIFVKAE